jgi:hypothetical protein
MCKNTRTGTPGSSVGKGSSLGSARGVWLVAALAALAGGCGTGGGAESVQTDTLAVQPSPNVDARRSLAITDQPVLVNFTLERVLGQLISTSGVAGLTPTTLFQQWWDTQNPGPGLGLGAHCDDTLQGGVSSLNGYPYTCRADPAEGSQASCDPFAPGSACAYLPVGLFMRFDQAPADGGHCGEYRIVFAKASGKTDGQNRNLLIFEAALPNPLAIVGIRGCEKFVRAWADLSTNDDIQSRRTKLESLYFDGYKQFSPIVSWDHFGANALGAGQIRTNSFVQPNAPRIWSLREFKLAKTCGAQCSLQFVPVTDKVNPFGPLFDPASTNPNAPAFQAAFLGEIPSLAAATASGIAMHTSDVFNSGQSQATGLSNETNYPANFGTGTNAFRTAIQASLTTLGSSLTPDDIVKRAQITACAGCHRFSSNVDVGGGIVWPASLGFTHVSERDVDLEVVGGVTRFKLSDALVNVLLPFRKQLVENFLNDVPLPMQAPTDPIGGRLVH